MNQFNLVRRPVSHVSKIAAFAMVGFLTIGSAFATDKKSKVESETTTAYNLDFSDLKQVPTITLVDKNLQIVAEFYGEGSGIKTRFPETFADASLLGEFTNHKIYLVTPAKK